MKFRFKLDGHELQIQIRRSLVTDFKLGDYKFLIQTGRPWVSESKWMVVRFGLIWTINMSMTNQIENWVYLNRPFKRPSIFRIIHELSSGPSTLDKTLSDHVIISILACILILAMIWVCIIYIKYAIRRDRVLKKIEEIQKGPSETLALLGLTMMVPIAPGNFSNGISKILNFRSFTINYFLKVMIKLLRKKE